ncbi:MAG: S41 family peptidase [Candidatus Saccharibacteria bacterium]
MTENQSEVEVGKSKVSRKKSRRQLSPVLQFMIIAGAVGLGFVAGTYKFQIMAAVGPVFGYKSHSGSLDLSSLQQTYNVLASNYDGNLDDSLLIEGANRGLVAAAGDKYTLYMNQQESQDFNNNLEGNIGAGIGAEIGIKNDKVTIIRALKGNPAEKAGLNINDVVLSVNDQSTEGWTVDEAVGEIRGEDGTTVKLSIQRGSEVKEYVITRAIIDNPSVDSSIVDGIGTITISRFDNKTGSLAQLAAQSFKNQGIKGVILDLRGNGGGYVDAARDVLGIWLNDQVVVTERVGSVVQDTIKTGNEAILNGVPTVVLVNGGSASASEIVAGALQDYGVAKLVGEKTFGKGSVQKLLGLDSGAQLKVTIARWYTPNGKNINQEGISPDNAAELTQSDIDAGVDPQINEAKRVLGL